MTFWISTVCEPSAAVVALILEDDCACKDFAALYRGKPAVIVGLRDAGFRRLLISADDAEAVAARLRDAG